MIFKSVRCNECGKVHNYNEGAKLEDRSYIGMTDKIHYCKNTCAKKLTIYQYIERLDANKPE